MVTSIFISLLFSTAHAETQWLKTENNPNELGRLPNKIPFHLLFIPNSEQNDSTGLIHYPSPPTANERPFIWEEWGLKYKPFVRANVIDSTDSIRFFGRIHKAAVWDAKVRK